jgi:oligopeptide/dipeptide ABC transporter ATP-binding protein
MRQRAMIAMALACEPKLLIADEPTTALDVTVQAQIIDLLRRLGRELKMSTLFITHDLGVVAEIASSVAVMYAGRIVETAPVTELFKRPLHPYSKGLLASIPSLNTRAQGSKRPRLSAIGGVVADASMLRHSCRFANRCPLHLSSPENHPLCLAEEPSLREIESDRQSRCHYVEQV